MYRQHEVTNGRGCPQGIQVSTNLGQIEPLGNSCYRPSVKDSTRVHGHKFEDQLAKVYYLGKMSGNLYSNLDGKDHPNLKWGENQGDGSYPQNQRNHPYQPPHMQRVQEKPMVNNHTVCSQRMDKIGGEIQLMRTNIKQVQFDCTYNRN